ncbi:MAG: hypothetical protein CSYNP_03548 [Syntrophus sp. SKADARSKE-3]|nr:hypothetical protein [Syntrophus sp. SKADARSKE-3]
MMDRSRIFHENRLQFAWRSSVIGPILKQIFTPTSYLDVGCSVGEFVKWFQDEDIPSYGVEGPLFPSDLYLGSPDSLIIGDLGSPDMLPLPTVDLLTCFIVIDRLDTKYWQQIARKLTFASDTIVTVVDENPLWTKHMEASGFTHRWDIASIITDLLEPWKDKEAIKPFYDHIQVFRRYQ